MIKWKLDQTKIDLHDQMTLLYYIDFHLAWIKGSRLEDNWKYIRPSKGKAYYTDTHTDSGNHPTAQLYNLSNDLGEKINLADKYPEKVIALENLIKKEEARTK